MNDAGLVVITAFISPYREDRAIAREIINSRPHDPSRFVEVHVDTPIDVCESRDPKGLYQKARKGEIPHFTGVSAPYEAPDQAELILPTVGLSVDACVDKLVAYLESQSAS